MPKKQLTSTTIARTTIFESRSDNLRESYGRTPHKHSTSLFQSLDYIGSHFRKKVFVKTTQFRNIHAGMTKVCCYARLNSETVLWNMECLQFQQTIESHFLTWASVYTFLCNFVSCENIVFALLVKKKDFLIGNVNSILQQFFNFIHFFPISRLYCV